MSDQDTATIDAPAVDDATEAPTQDEPTDQPQEGDDAGKDDVWDPERARRKIAKLNSEAANLRKRVQEAPKPEDVAAKDKRIADLESTALRYEVALELGLPKQIASRLQGSTREEMIADAEQLLDLVAKPAAPPVKRPAERLRGGGEPEREPEETDTRKIAERMFRN